MLNILIVGGAGYIGSYMCKYLSKNGYNPIVLDNLIYGHKEAVKWGVFIEGSIADSTLLDQIFRKYQIIAVMHFAAFCYVGESVTEPLKYYQNNLSNTITLLNCMVKNNVLNLVFSSSCAIFGESDGLPITENQKKNPINPYGKSKLMVEKILDDLNKAYNLNYVCLRYFNAAGADPDIEVGEDHIPETHIIPLVLQTALGKKDSITIFGDDYSTKDGTCIRDYIHIVDLAQAHLLSLERLLNHKLSANYNLGSGTGYSVMEILELACKITNKKISYRIFKRREGDPAVLISSNEKVFNELGWEPKFGDIETIIETAWKWHQKMPNGYKS